MKFRTSHKYLPPALLLAALFCAVVPARANDASLDLSGSPRLMAGHPSVRMQSERIFCASRRTASRPTAASRS
jgi:hypothetical protein